MEWVFVWLFSVRQVVPIRTAGVSRNSRLFSHTDNVVGVILFYHEELKSELYESFH